MKYLLLIIIPIIILVKLSSSDEPPFWQGHYDPAYIYLFNGLNFADKYGNIGHYDNPGTPAHVISALIIKTTYIIRNSQKTLPEDVILNPEYYLKIIAWTFTIFNCVLIFFSGLVIYKLTSDLVFGLLFQSVALFSTAINFAFYRVSPEPVLFGTATILCLLFLRSFYFGKPLHVFVHHNDQAKSELIIKDYRISVLVFGIIIGFALATKINSLPLVFIPLLLLDKFRRKIAYILVVVLSFVVFTLPVVSYYPRLFLWTKNITIHSGHYGYGTNEIIDSSVFMENFLKFIKGEPLIVFVMVVSLIVIIRQVIQKKHDIHLKILIVFLLVQIVEIIMVLKHFRFHYFMPILPTLAVNLFVILKIAEFSYKTRLATVILFIAACFVLNFVIRKDKIEGSQIVYHQDDINIYAYQSRSPLYALKFGDDYARNINASLLEKEFGKQCFYNVWSKQVTDWKQEISLDSLMRLNRNLFFFTSGRYVSRMPPPFKIKLMSEGKYQIEANSASLDK